VEKLVRGITYVTTKRYIEPTHQIEVLFLHPEAAKPFVDLLKRFGTQHDRGPGICITRAIPEDEPNSGVFEIEIWGRLRMYATVRPIQGK
jgi:hypothetical protein